MVLASCVEEKNLYNPDEGTPEDAQLGLSTDFLLKTQRSIFITAVDGDGKSQAGVKFGVFMSQPYTGEGVISIDPVFVGYTDASGKLKAEVVIGNNVSKIYVAPLTAGYGQVKEADVQDFVSLVFKESVFLIWLSRVLFRLRFLYFPDRSVVCINCISLIRMLK